MKRIAAVAIAVLCVVAVAGVISFATGVSKLEAQYELDTTWGAKGSGNGEFKYVEDLAIDADGNILVTDALKYLNHSCWPNAELGGFRLKALVAIRAGQEITMSYGADACDCDRDARQMERT